MPSSVSSSNCNSSKNKNKNSVRNDCASMLNSLMDTPKLDKNSENHSIINELQKYDASIYCSTDEKLIKKYGPILFFKENDKEFPNLSEIAKMIFCLVPSSSPVEEDGTPLSSLLFL
jgi:hypothetical protein